MDDGSEGLIQESTEAGIAADRRLPSAALAGPGHREASEHAPAAAAADRLLGDRERAFELGSSFVAPQIAEDLSVLASLVERLEKKHGARPVAAVFGHADPVGKEDLNKKLSGRRAAAVYALLTRRADIWEDIYSQTRQLHVAARGRYLGRTGSSDPSHRPGLQGQSPAFRAHHPEELIRSFQADQGLNVDGKAGADTRAKLSCNTWRSTDATARGIPSA